LLAGEVRGAVEVIEAAHRHAHALITAKAGATVGAHAALTHIAYTLPKLTTLGGQAVAVELTLEGGELKAGAKDAVELGGAVEVALALVREAAATVDAGDVRGAVGVLCAGDVRNTAPRDTEHTLTTVGVA
jgi:hypothetical protein